MKPIIGTTIYGVHGNWTVVGDAVLAREGRRSVWKVTARYTCRSGETSEMPLFIPA
jgi:hypothetical protein